ncbi:MAG TPA: ATP-binding protein [Candidatus Xenobia bacterium]
MSKGTTTRSAGPHAVELAVPANREYTQILRLVLSGIGVAMGLNLEEIEDLKLAVGEACYSVGQDGGGPTGQLTIRAAVENRQLTVDVRQASDKPSLPRLFAAGESTEKSIGVALMKHMVDRVEYNMGRDSVEIRLIKYLQQEASTP